MFAIDFGKTTSSEETINKQFSVLATLSGSLKESTSIVDPVILIEYDGVPMWSYAHIPIFGRYYYIGKDIKSVRDGLWEIPMHSDPLMSFRDEILANSVLLARQENVYNQYLPDNLMETESTTLVQTLDFGAEFKNAGVILITQ